MSERFHEGLKNLKKDILLMGDLAKAMLENAVKALKDQDQELADWVTSKKDEIRDMDTKIEEDALKLITLYQPMAIDIRTIGTILKLNTYLTRIGRYGKDIAALVPEFSKKDHVGKLMDIEALVEEASKKEHLGKMMSIPYQANIVVGMIEDALSAFRSQDISEFKDIKEKEEEVDALRYSVFRQSVSYMMEDPKLITRCMHYVMVSRYLERCGDHACKIGEKIHYMLTGEHIEIY